MATKDFYFKFFFKDWLVSTQGMDAEVRGWYITLLCHQADKHRLPNDLENLAELAGVKISQFERFKECFKRTLKHKFTKTEDGELYNLKMDEVINNRKKDHSIQSKRATIGVFVKKLRKSHQFEESRWAEISAGLMECDFEGLSNKDKYNVLSVRFKRMLDAVINNSNSNSNYISKHKEKRGVGKKTNGPELDLSELKAELKNEFTWKETICRNMKEVEVEFSSETFDLFLDQFFKVLGNDGETEKTVKDSKKHFARWLNIEISKIKTNEKSTSNNTQGGSDAFRRKTAQRLGFIQP